MTLFRNYWILKEVRKEWPPRADDHFSTPFVRIANVKKPRKRMGNARVDAATSPDSRPQNGKMEQLNVGLGGRHSRQTLLQKKSSGESRTPTKVRVVPEATTMHSQPSGSYRGKMLNAGLAG